MRLYGHKWRTRTRPRILDRDGNRCRRCGRGGRLDIAHLDGNNVHDDDANLAAHCRRCHVKLDYPVAQAKARDTRAGRKDRGRPLLEALAEGLPPRAAVSVGRLSVDSDLRTSYQSI